MTRMCSVAHALRYLCLIVAAAASGACALYNRIGNTMPATCVWYELDDVPGLEPLRGRAWCGGGADCAALKSVGAYRLRRADYTVELSNGGHCRPRVYLRVRSATGANVSVASEHFLPFDPSLFPETLPDGPYTHELSWRLINTDGPPDYYPRIERAEFRVISVDGREIGQESIRIVRRTGGRTRVFQ